MKVLSLIAIGALLLSFSSCRQESLEDKAEREAKDYTRKYCPTPKQNYSRTDSIVFDKRRKVYIYYVSFYDEMDNQEVIDMNRDRIASMLQQTIRESVSVKNLVEAGFRFEYVCHSGSDPKKVLLKVGL